LSALYKKAGF